MPNLSTRFVKFERKWKIKREVQIGLLDRSYPGPPPDLANLPFYRSCQVRGEARVMWELTAMVLRSFTLPPSLPSSNLFFFFPPLSLLLPPSSFLLLLLSCWRRHPPLRTHARKKKHEEGGEFLLFFLPCAPKTPAVVVASCAAVQPPQRERAPRPPHMPSFCLFFSSHNLQLAKSIELLAMAKWQRLCRRCCCHLHEHQEIKENKTTRKKGWEGPSTTMAGGPLVRFFCFFFFHNSRARRCFGFYSQRSFYMKNKHKNAKITKRASKHGWD